VNALGRYLADLGNGTLRGWQAFWFTPADPATLGLIRLLAGAMLLYTHLVWTLDLEAFFGPEAWLSPQAVGAFTASIRGNALWSRWDFMWSYFWLIESRPLLWAVHLAALVVFAMLMLGLYSRVVSVLAAVIAVSYVNRVPAALFGLDQINCMLALYLAAGPCGAAYSLDRLLARRRAGGPQPPAAPSVGANISVRLIQLHMCVIYLFAGLSKLSGPIGSWWDGTAMWLAFANQEYQSLDMTWLADWPLVVNLLTHVTVAWEISYAALVWPRLTRPLVIALAIPLHMGIALCLGMMTFGLAMLIGNLAFVSPHLVRASIDGLRRRRPGETAAVSPTAPPRRATRPLAARRR
jgi:hypothetical protein